MTAYQCPHCNKPTITLGRKYLAGKWVNIYCDECGGRSCSNPYILAPLYFLYVWDVLLFGTVAYEEQSLFYVGVMVTGFLILDWFNLYVPLMKMKGNNKNGPDTSDAASTDKPEQKD